MVTSSLGVMVDQYWESGTISGSRGQYLGVMVDQYLNWKEQITAIKKKVSREIGMLKYSKRYLPLLTIQSMYKSLVEPYFRYCCPVSGSCGSTAINELQKLQNRLQE